MNIPQSPPAWQPLMDRVIQRGKVKQFIKRGHQENLKPKRYLHWEDFQNQASKRNGLTKKEQWAAIRMARAMRSQAIPLEDTNGQPFTFFLTPKAFGMLRDIDLNSGTRPSNHTKVEEEAGRHQFNSIIEEALASSQLEGTVLTRSEAREMIRSQQTPSTKQGQRVMNSYRALRLLGEQGDRPLTPEFMLLLHREMTAGTLENPKLEGQFRREHDECSSVFHSLPDATTLNERIAKLCDFANERRMTGFLHPVIRSILLHFWISYEQPFVHGNGRMARALFYWSMLRSGYCNTDFFSISHEILKSPKQYYRAFLQTETDGNDLNYFILQQLKVIASSIESLQESIHAKQAETELLRRNLETIGDFNRRQTALIKHALEHPFANYTVVGHQNSHGTSNQTAKNDLCTLEQQGYLLRGKRGKAFVYSPVPDLVGKLGL